MNTYGITDEQLIELLGKVKKLREEYNAQHEELLKKDHALYYTNLEKQMDDIYKEYGIDIDKIYNSTKQTEAADAFAEKIKNIKPIIDKPGNQLWFTYRRV